MLKKRFFKTKNTCLVTFQLPRDIKAQSVALVGEFNDWDESATPMNKVKATWKTTLELERGREYQFRYLVNGTDWHNDPAADRYVPNNIDDDNCVVLT